MFVLGVITARCCESSLALSPFINIGSTLLLKRMSDFSPSPSGVALFSLSIVLASFFSQLTNSRTNTCKKGNDSCCVPSTNEKKQSKIKLPFALGPDFYVVIIGGGIGGLATALALQREGIKCTVFERDKVFEDRKQGYGLTLSNTPTGGLAKLGILEDCIRRDCNSSSHWVFTPEGKVIGYYGRAFKPDTRGASGSQEHAGRGNLRIPRQDLRRLLLERLAPGTVQWGRVCTGIREEEESVHVSFDNGAEVRADLVVGADGLRSRVRGLRDRGLQQQQQQEQQRDGGVSGGIQYIGVSVILGISSFQHPLLSRQGFYILDGTHRLFTMPFREDKEGKTVLTMWQLSFSGLSEGEANLLKMSGARAQLAEASQRTTDWFPCVHELVRGTAAADIWSTPLYDRAPMQALPKQRGGRVTVLGDACHPMSMFKGQGANQALEDAPRLVEWLLKQGKQFSTLTVPMRVRHFEKEMKDRTSKWVQASRAASQFLHSPAALVDSTAFGIDGLAAADSVALLGLLEDRGVTAATAGEALEARVLAEWEAHSCRSSADAGAENDFNSDQ